MKRFLLAILTLLMLGAQAQYCGNSGPSQCFIDTTHAGNFYPVGDSLAPFVNGTVSSTVIQYNSADTITFGGQNLTIQWLRFDSIGNLPNGLCWSTSDTTNKFIDSGCIKFNGTTCSLPGQYKLRVIVTVFIGVPIVTNADVAGLKLYIRVKNMGDADTPVDTSQTSANPFIAYGNAISGCAPDTTCHAAFTLYHEISMPDSWYALNQSTSTKPLTYFWNWGDGSGSNLATPSHVYTTPGIYNICLTVADITGCSDTYCDSSYISSVQVVNQLPTGITQTTATAYDFKVFPNPASSSITVSVPEALIGSTLTLTDITGREINSVWLSTANHELSTASLANGIYFVTIRNKSTLLSKKLVVQR